MKKKIFQENTKIIYHERVSKNYFKIGLRSSKIPCLAQPGQFIGIKISDNYEVLLRRPFSIHGAIDPNIEVLYEVAGKGTELLSRKKPGEYLDVIGPLGNGFNYPLSTIHYPLSTIHYPTPSSRKTAKPAPHQPRPALSSNPENSFSICSFGEAVHGSIARSWPETFSPNERCCARAAHPERFRGLSPFCSPIVSQIPAHQENAELSPIPVRADRCSGM